VFFPGVCRVGTGDPVFGPFPPRLEHGQGLANGFATDTPWGHPHRVHHGGRQVESPHTGGFAEGARALMEQGTPWLASGRRIDRVWGPRWRRRVASHGREPPGMERLDGVAHGLIVAAQGLGDDTGVLARGAGSQNLAAAHHTRIGRP
jgi:hypothetical protein